MVTEPDAIAEGLLEPRASPRDQVVAGILHVRRVRAGKRQRGARDLHLGPPRAARQILDGLAVAVTRGEVHGAEVALGAQDAVHQAHALEELPPVERLHHAEAGDDVPHRHIGGPLALVLGAHQLLGRRAGGGEPLLEPGERRRGVGVLVSQALDELHRIGGREYLVAQTREGLGVRRPAALPEEDVGEPVRLEAGGAPLDDLLGQPPEVLDQGEPQGDGHRPDLGDQERLDPLERPDEAPEGGGLEAAVGVLDVGPGQPHRARHVPQRALDESGKLPVEAGRKIGADFVEDVLDDVEVVHQPLCGRHRGALFVDDGREGAVVPEEHPSVVPDAGEEGGAGALPVGDPVAGEGLGELFQPLGAEELAANRLRTEEGHRRGARREGLTW